MKRVFPWLTKKNLRWHHVYYVLAAIDLITIIAALMLTQWLVMSYEQSVHDNKRMSLNVNEFIKLGYIAQSVNEPGNRVFETRDVNTEKLALAQNLTWFNTASRHARTNLENSFSTNELNKLNVHLDALTLAMSAMVAETNNIFIATNKGQERVAGKHMTAMDAQFYQITRSLGAITQYITDIQNEHFEKQVNKAKQIEYYEMAISVIVIMIISMVTLFGHRLGKKLKENEDKISESLEQAKQSALVKEQFLANMSHEIRTPMNATLSLLKLMDREALSSKDKRYLKLALVSGENLLCIINDILNLSKIESDKMELENLDFNVNELIKDQVSIYQESYANEEVKLHLNFTNICTTWLKGDYHKLTQVFTNLLNNAFKFTAKGEITVVVATKKVEQTIVLSIEVNDTGIGIAEDKIDKIFEPFSQADASTTRDFGGTGLGLTISKKICQQMGGDLTVTSKESCGSSFKLKVFLGIGEKLPSADDSPNTNEINEETTSFKPLNIHLLVAEDNRINQLVLKDALTKMGCSFDIAKNGQEALELLNDEHCAVIMDCMMPIKDGYQATQDIRELRSSLSSIYILALTANSLEGDKEKCLQSGMNDYLSKPVVFHDLYRKLQLLSTPETEK